MQVAYPSNEDAIYASALKVVRDTMVPNFMLCKP
jgi:hypothetical protein